MDRPAQLTLDQSVHKIISDGGTRLSCMLYTRDDVKEINRTGMYTHEEPNKRGGDCEISQDCSTKPQDHDDLEFMPLKELGYYTACDSRTNSRNL